MSGLKIAQNKLLYLFLVLAGSFTLSIFPHSVAMYQGILEHWKSHAMVIGYSDYVYGQEQFVVRVGTPGEAQDRGKALKRMSILASLS
jgi:hypothetical protein